ncbi:MAG: polyprenyl synthetase family protein [Pseudomonadota bacterium]
MKAQTDAGARIERTLSHAIKSASGDAAPPILAEALAHAVFPGGARVRPRLCLAVADACDAQSPSAAEGAAAAIELLHCASLIHDDMPCFDDAPMRRGKPSIHAAYGEPIAVLAGDAMIVLAFETLARGCVTEPQRLGGLVSVIAQAVGMPHGIVAGQAWESEPQVDLAQYQRAKTGALFVGATTAGAIAAGADPGPWRPLGERLGEAFQVADDILDVTGDAEALGKPLGQDAAHARPNAVHTHGLDGAIRHMGHLVEAAADAVPDCRGAGMLRELVMLQAKRLGPSVQAAVSAVA